MDFPFLFVKYGPFLLTFPDDDMGNPCRNVEVNTKKSGKKETVYILVIIFLWLSAQ